MKSFIDTTGRTWELIVNVSTIKRVRGLCDVNIIDIITVDENNKPNADLLERLASDPVLLVDVLYAVCKPECDIKNVNDEQFGVAMSGDVIEKATQALLEEIVDFFPEAKRRVFQKVLQTTQRFATAANQKLQVLLDDEQFEENLLSQLEKLNGSSTSAPESVE